MRKNITTTAAICSASCGGARTTGRTTLLPRTATSVQFSLSKRIFSSGTYRVHMGADPAHEPGNSRTRSLRVHR